MTEDIERLFEAVERRVGWARERANETTGLDIWARRYEMDVPSLVYAIRIRDERIEMLKRERDERRADAQAAADNWIRPALAQLARNAKEALRS